MDTVASLRDAFVERMGFPRFRGSCLMRMDQEIVLSDATWEHVDQRDDLKMGEDGCRRRCEKVYFFGHFPFDGEEHYFRARWYSDYFPEKQMMFDFYLSPFSSTRLIECFGYGNLGGGREFLLREFTVLNREDARIFRERAKLAEKGFLPDESLPEEEPWSPFKKGEYSHLLRSKPKRYTDNDD